jgi:Tfp pilus assembly protein PilF
MVFQPGRFYLLAVLALSMPGDCRAEGFGRYVPDVSKLTSWMGKDEREAPMLKKDDGVPAPEINEHNYAQVQLAIGDSLAKEGNFEAARSAYHAALRNDDSLARTYHRLALLNEKTGHEGDSKELFLKAIKLDPANADIACDYGYWCYLRNDWKESQQQLQRALQLDPKSKRAHNNLALLLARTDRPTEALHHFKLAGLSSDEARTNLGFVYLSEQRMPQAKAELERALAENPTSGKARDVLEKMAKVESQSGSSPTNPAPIAKRTNVPAVPSVQTADNSRVKRQFDLNLGPGTAKPLRVAGIIEPQTNSSDVRRSATFDEPAANHTSLRTFDPARDVVSRPAPSVQLTEFAAPPSQVSAATAESSQSQDAGSKVRFLPAP